MLITAAEVRGSPLRLRTVPEPMLVVTVWVTWESLSAAAPENVPPEPERAPPPAWLTMSLEMTTMLPPAELMIRWFPISAVVVELTSFCALPAETPAVDA
ncbi:hypothetical protein ACVWWK_006737 [Bradyrhizobium sp. LB9.1b]